MRRGRRSGLGRHAAPGAGGRAVGGQQARESQVLAVSSAGQAGAGVGATARVRCASAGGQPIKCAKSSRKREERERICGSQKRELGWAMRKRARRYRRWGSFTAAGGLCGGWTFGMLCPPWQQGMPCRAQRGAAPMGTTSASMASLTPSQGAPSWAQTSCEGGTRYKVRCTLALPGATCWSGGSATTPARLLERRYCRGGTRRGRPRSDHAVHARGNSRIECICAGGSRSAGRTTGGCASWGQHCPP